MPDWEDKALEVASFRYRIIADAAEADGRGLAAAIAAAGVREYVDPRGTTLRPSTRTLWRWLKSYQHGGLVALKPKRRRDAGQLRALSPQVLDRALELRHENSARATLTLIDMLERVQLVAPGALKRSTLDRHLDRLGGSRRRLHRLGNKTFEKILTTAPLELVIADFHHGPYVRLADDARARRALLLAFIDHFSRYVLEARYYLHEDFAALRFGFRRLLMLYGPCRRLYLDNGPSFHTARFHAACRNEAIDIQVVHSKASTSEGRGCCERFNRTVKEQFETEARARDELPTLDELNGYFEAWLAERYHRHTHAETARAPFDLFHTQATLRTAPDLSRIDELLRLRKSAKVHKKWCTVEVSGVRYVVQSALRGRRVQVLYDPFAPDYVLIELNAQIIERAYPQKAGHNPPQSQKPAAPKTSTDYLELLRQAHHERTRAELSALDLRRSTPTKELSLTQLQALITNCRGQSLSPAECSTVAAFFRKLRPIDPAAAELAAHAAQRRLGCALHVSVYLDALQAALLRQRAKGKSP